MARPTFHDWPGGPALAATRLSPAWLRTSLGAWVIGVGICAVTASGCAKTRAQTIPTGPPLAVPAPPPRVIAPPEEPEIAAVPPIVEPPPAATAAPPLPRTASRPTPPSTAPSTIVPPPAPVVPVVEPPRVVRPSVADLAEERRIQTILQRARRDIGRVVYQRLSADGRAQYDQSRSLDAQAEQAIKDRNWLFAQTLADKAATLAAELVAR